MILRRLSAIVTWLLLLHVNVVASDLVCARHHAAARSATAAPMTHHAARDATEQDHAGDGNEESCKIPARSDCCRAMASCAVTVAVGDAISGTSPAIERVAPAALSLDAPATVARGPEPPPPKA